MTNEDKHWRWQSICDVAAATEGALINAGADAEFAAKIADMIRHKAGSYLPPASSVFDVTLYDTTVEP